MKDAYTDAEAAPAATVHGPPDAHAPERLNRRGATSVLTGHRLLLAISERSVALAAGITALRILVGVAISRIAVDLIPIRDINLTTGPPPPLTSTFIHWDAKLYQLIATSGYVKSEPGRSSFFPVYPFLTRLLHDIGIGYNAAALVVTWIAFFLAVWGLLELSKAVWPRSQAARAGMLFAWFPASVFLISGYAEATFVALVAWCCVAVVRKRLVLAALLAAVASATRPEGALLAVVIVTSLALSRRYVQAVLLGLLSEVGLIAYSAFVWVRYGSPIEYVHVQSTVWHRHATIPFRPFFASLVNISTGHLWGSPTLFANIRAVFLLEDALVIVAIIAIVRFAMHARSTPSLLPFVPFVVLYFLLIVSNGPAGTSPEGSARVLMCIAPLYLVAVRLKGDLTWYSVLAGSAAAATVFQVVFNLNLWFT